MSASSKDDSENDNEDVGEDNYKGGTTQWRARLGPFVVAVVGLKVGAGQRLGWAWGYGVAWNWLQSCGKVVDPVDVKGRLSENDGFGKLMA